jgi:hypothetical protein
MYSPSAGAGEGGGAPVIGILDIAKDFGSDVCEY